MTATAPIRPLELAIPQHELDDLRDRLRRTQWPEAETVGAGSDEVDWSQGAPRSYLTELARYWAENYD